MEHIINDLIQPFLLAIITGGVPIFLGYLAYLLKKKTGLDWEEKDRKQAEDAVLKAVLATEERKMLDLKTNAKTWEPYESHKFAIELASKFMPTLTSEKADIMVSAILGGLKNYGASGEKGIN